jgi:hypothetical protein
MRKSIFAVQTRRQELSDAQAADLERLELRKQTSEEFKALSGAAREAGVQSKMCRNRFAYPDCLLKIGLLWIPKFGFDNKPIFSYIKISWISHSNGKEVWNGSNGTNRSSRAPYCKN